MTGETLGSGPSIEISPDKLRGIEHDLGPEGHGAFVIRDVIQADKLEALKAEIFDTERVQFRDVHSRYYNQRGKLIVQNHTVYALKLLQGDPAFIERVPQMRQLASETEQLIRGLDFIFPALNNWTADEMSLHRYDDPEIGLSFHKDNLRFPGLVAVATLEGESDFCILDEKGEIHYHPVYPGDVALTRAPDLFPSNRDIRGEHAVLNLRTPFRTAFIVRANSRPHDTLKGFEYANWDLLPSNNPYAPREPGDFGS